LVKNADTSKMKESAILYGLVERSLVKADTFIGLAEIRSNPVE